ncbi:hypothetical protein [Celeribacter sp.]|uniref:hypothetical protein n=1 Tax=Celeribacter sp. TaxID=1890673 RepID=UPI003A9195E4
MPRPRLAGSAINPWANVIAGLWSHGFEQGRARPAGSGGATDIRSGPVCPGAPLGACGG